MRTRDAIEALTPQLNKLAENMHGASAGIFLYDVELKREGAYNYLRIYIDKPGGVTLDDCEAYHLAARPLTETIQYDFMEVSSPGLDRPLKTVSDWQAALDHEVSVRLFRTESGAKTHTGIIRAVESDAFLLETATMPMRIPYKAVAVAKPIIRFNEEDDEHEQ